MKRSRLILLFVLATCGAQSVLAQGWQSGRQGGGWNKLEMCHGCHDMGMRGGMGMGMGMGMSRGDTAPKLGGQHAAYLGKALKAYRSGERRHPVMNRMASMLTDRDIADIARSYAQAE
ncbi:cytochrome c [Sulfuritalea sp.]|uniref:c-type cytochrome n=1 Tax=Sulfuritalea sp. TaxID=2480090 RepID=UPI00286E2B28|nr:cytochrome c [Sulfuritalea sp.]